MRLLFDSNTGEIVHVVPDRDWTLFENPTTIPLEVFYIEEELPANRAACIDLWRVHAQRDVAGRPKYHMVNGAGGWELHAHDGWEPAPERFGLIEEQERWAGS